MPDEARPDRTFTLVARPGTGGGAPFVEVETNAMMLSIEGARLLASELTRWADLAEETVEWAERNGRRSPDAS